MLLIQDDEHNNLTVRLLLRYANLREFNNVFTGNSYHTLKISKDIQACVLDRNALELTAIAMKKIIKIPIFMYRPMVKWFVSSGSKSE